LSICQEQSAFNRKKLEEFEFVKIGNFSLRVSFLHSAHQ